MNRKIGAYSVLAPERLIIPEGESASVDIMNGTETIPLRLSFVNDESEKKETSITVKGHGRYADLIFKNWNSPFGQCTNKPIKIGTTDQDEPLSIMASCMNAGGTRIVDLQVMIGGGE